jgi:hypothetical protein
MAATKTKSETETKTEENKPEGATVDQAPPPNVSAPKEAADVPAQAVFMPVDIPPDVLCMNSRIYKTNFYYDKEGNLIPSERWSEGEEPPEVSVNERVDYYPGDLVDLPKWDAALLERTLATGNYVQPSAQAEVKAKMQELYDQTEATTKDILTYKRLMKSYWNELNERGLIILPQGELYQPKREGK